MDKLITFTKFTINLKTFPVFCTYLVMCFVSGIVTKYFRPIEPTKTLILHNFICCLASTINLILFILAYMFDDYQTFYDKTPGGPYLTAAYFLYYLLKLYELLDTVFMILRHRHRQITFLHVYHHSSMVLLSDLSYRMYPWVGIGVYLALNCFIHIVLYLYYALAAMKSPWVSMRWRKTITQMQILQFLIGMYFSSQGYLYHGYCMYGPLYGLSMTILFSNFYLRAYVFNKNKSKASLKGV